MRSVDTALVNMLGDGDHDCSIKHETARQIKRMK